MTTDKPMTRETAEKRLLETLLRQFGLSKVAARHITWTFFHQRKDFHD